MNKQRFINILQDYDNIPDHDRNSLHELAKIYPYSQIIHTLIAKAHNDAHTRLAGQTLNYAAMYSTDRGVLKEIILHIPEEQAHRAHNFVDSHEDTRKEMRINNEVPHLQAEDLRKEIWLDLAALKKSKAFYLEWEAEEKLVIAGNGEDEKIKIKRKDKKVTAKPETIVAEKKVNGRKSKTKVEPEEKAPTVKRKTSKAKKSSVLKPAPHQEQKEIIEKFISEEPSITARPLKVSENQPDLSEASTAFNEDLISENLANIFIKQGKKEKAIDIYKKLIWKFPQKKAYFASQIDELQK